MSNSLANYSTVIILYTIKCKWLCTTKNGWTNGSWKNNNLCTSIMEFSVIHAGVCCTDHLQTEVDGPAAQIQWSER